MSRLSVSFSVVMHFQMLTGIDLPRGDDMGYQIVYEPASKKIPAFYKKSRIPEMAAACFLLFLLLVNGFWPRGREVVQQIVWPGDREAAVQAAEIFVQELRYGEPFADAVESFCREILQGADFAG